MAGSVIGLVRPVFLSELDYKIKLLDSIVHEMLFANRGHGRVEIYLLHRAGSGW